MLSALLFILLLICRPEGPKNEEAQSHPYLRALRQQARLLTDCSVSAAAAAAVIEAASSPDDVPLLLDPGGPLGHLGACCDAYVSLPVSAPCLNSSNVCSCPPVTSTSHIPWNRSSSAAAAAAVAGSMDGCPLEGSSRTEGSSVADWLGSPNAGEAAEFSSEGEAPLTAEELLAAVQHRQQQQHLQQRRLQQQHQRELHSHFALQACAHDYQLMAADVLPVSPNGSWIGSSSPSSDGIRLCNEKQCCDFNCHDRLVQAASFWAECATKHGLPCCWRGSCIRSTKT